VTKPTSSVSFSSLAPRSRPYFSFFGALFTASLTFAAASQLVAAQEITLYENDFEDPNQPVSVSCGNSLDQAGVNATYGKPGYGFIEQYSIETVVLHDPAGKYSGQSNLNGDYALGMLGVAQDDKLAFRFDIQGQQFLNVAMDVSSIDVDGCGGPFDVETPKFKVSLLDDSDREFDWDSEKLDEKALEGEASSSPWTFHWTRGTVALDAGKATNGNVIVVFDLVSAGYAVFDNLKITASKLAVVGDRDDDGIEDGMDNCPSAANPSQTNMDEDAAGDACDPSPRNPNKCGDRSGDGEDDCVDWCDSHESAACSDEAGGSGGRGGRSAGGAGGNDASDAGEPDNNVSGDGDDTPNHHGSTGSHSSTSTKSKSKGCSVSLVGAESGSDTAFAAIFTFGAIWITRARARRRIRPNRFTKAEGKYGRHYKWGHKAEHWGARQ
jgi:hypothetical protein